MATALATSVGLPPPTATMASQPDGQVLFGPLDHLEVLGVGGEGGEDLRFQAGSVQVVEGLLDPAGLDHALVADQKDLGGADARRALAELAEGTAAEDDLRGHEFADIHETSYTG